MKNKTVSIAIANKMQSISARERRHALLELQAEIHAEIAPDINLRLDAIKEAFSGKEDKYIPFAPMDYIAADTSIVAEIVSEHTTKATETAPVLVAATA